MSEQDRVVRDEYTAEELAAMRMDGESPFQTDEGWRSVDHSDEVVVDAVDALKAKLRELVGDQWELRRVLVQEGSRDLGVEVIVSDCPGGVPEQLENEARQLGFAGLQLWFSA